MRHAAASIALAAAACGADEHVLPADAPLPIDSPWEGDGCASELLCPPPDADKATICGRLWDAATDMPIAVATEDTLRPCDPNNPAPDGPCSLSVRFVDALDFASDPNGAASLIPEAGVYVDGCNRYRGVNIPGAPSGTIAVIVDDAAGVADGHRVTAVAVTDNAGLPMSNVRAYVTRTITDVAWSTPVFGSDATFAERGVVVMAFTHQRVPQAGVQARREGALVPGDDHYFTDDGLARSTVSATTSSTGTNGSVLVVGSSGLMLHDGLGGEPAGCRWPTVRAIATPGVVSVQLADAETPAGGPCP